MIKIPVKKLKSGFELPALGIGTFGMGGEFEHDLDNNDKPDIRAIRAAIDLGVRHIDTAEIYADGHAEVLVGKAIKKYKRSKLFITSKVEPAHFGYGDILKSCEESLNRLNTPYLDLYLLHWYEEDAPLKEAMAGMDELKKQGKIRNIGVSNFGIKRLKEARKYSGNKIVCDQVHYNLIVREPETKKLLKFCRENDVMLVAYRPTELGKLAEKTPPIIREIAEKCGKTPAQIALNWLISQKNVATIAKSRSIRHLKENLGAISWNLEKGDIEKLREKYPGQKAVSPLGMME